MKLYYSRGACSLAVRILIHELGLKSNFEAVDLKTKVTETGANYWEINPKGSVPALLLDDNLVLTENAIIHQYLAEHFQKDSVLPAPNNFKRYRILETQNFITTEIHKGFSPLFNPNIPEDLKANIFMPALKNKFKIINATLENNSFLMGAEFTLPDAYLFVMLLWAKHFKIDFQDCANITPYFDSMKSRPSIQKALAEEGIPTTL